VQYSSPSACSKFLGACCNSLNNQLHFNTKFASLASDSATNLLKLATIVHRSLHNACPQYLPSLLHTYTPTPQLRSASLNLLSQPRAKIALAFRGFRHTGHSIWNFLPPHLRSINTYTAFKSNLKTHLFCSARLLAPNNTIHVLLIHIYMLILAPKLFYITLYYVIEAMLELDVSRFRADMAAATPLSSTVCRCNGSKVDMSSMVLAAEAKSADGASKVIPRTPRSPHLTGSNACFQLLSSRTTFSVVDSESRRTASYNSSSGLSQQGAVRNT